ncbi:MAG: serine/threonine-protein kinase, partial [Bryobacteraceae bacterium]
MKSLFLRASEASRPDEVLKGAPSGDRAAAERMLHVQSGWDGDLRLDDLGQERNATWLFTTGTIVSARFEIVRPLGRGGMGEVYEAQDRVKDLAVAIKVVLSSTAIDGRTAERLLRREVALAQMISHRNICRIYDPYVHDPVHGPQILVVSMELLRGDTLSNLLVRKGRLQAEEVLEIARQLAAGIDAAHAAGVIHRDLKPSNVILVDESGGPRAVITDFGLARQTSGQSVTQLSGAVAGTLRYMAPEQIEGRADQRSDLYTLAIILYELVTGELPFSGDSDLSVALGRLSSPPRDPATLVPGISLAWRAALLRGLSKAPEERFQTARDLVQAIESPPPAIALWRRLLWFHVRAMPRWALLSAPFLLVLLASLTPYFLRPRATLFPPFQRILITDLRHDQTKDGALLGAITSLTAAVAQSPHLIVARPRELQSTLAKMGKQPSALLDDETVRQLALRTGESAVLFGSVSKANGYSLHVRMESLGGDPRRASVSERRDFQAANGQELHGAIAAAAAWVRKLSGEGARELNEQNARPEDLTTASWEALRLLEEAQARRLSNDPRGALVFATEALDLDPEFAAAEAFRADVHTDLRQFKEAYAGYKHALELVK